MPAAPDYHKAVSDLKLLDISLDLVGSQAVELGVADSDVNVLVTMPLKSLVRSIQEQTPVVFEEIPASKRWAREKTLHLLHISSGAELAVVSRWTVDIFLRERDGLFRLLIEHDDRVLVFLRLVAEWYSRVKDIIPVKDGYPNRYAFKLIGLHFLMNYRKMVVLPPLADAGPFVDTTNRKFQARSAIAKGTTVPIDDLFQEFLKRLGTSDTKGLYAHLRNPYEEEWPDNVQGRWMVIDPATCLEIVSYSLKTKDGGPTEHFATGIALAARSDAESQGRGVSTVADGLT